MTFEIGIILGFFIGSVTILPVTIALMRALTTMPTKQTRPAQTPAPIESEWEIIAASEPLQIHS